MQTSSRRILQHLHTMTAHHDNQRPEELVSPASTWYYQAGSRVCKWRLQLTAGSEPFWQAPCGPP